MTPILIQAAGSGIGSAAIQIARHAGATIITTASTDEKLRRAAEMGAHHTINYTEEEFPERVRELTGGRGVDLVMEHVGGEVFTKSLECLKRDGAIVTVGGHSGEVVPFDIIPFFRNEYRLLGSSGATRPELLKVMEMVFEGTFRPVISRTLDLSRAAEAHRLVDSPGLLRQGAADTLAFTPTVRSPERWERGIAPFLRVRQPSRRYPCQWDGRMVSDRPSCRVTHSSMYTLSLKPEYRVLFTSGSVPNADVKGARASVLSRSPSPSVIIRVGTPTLGASQRRSK